jgi:hypothetical protein
VHRDPEDPSLLAAHEGLPGEIVALAAAFEKGVEIEQPVPASFR